MCVEQISLTDHPAAAEPVRPVRVLAYLKEPERSAMRYERLAEAFGGVHIEVASNLSEITELEKVDVLITIGGHIGGDAAEIYRKAKNLKWVQSFGTGTDNISGHPDLADDVVVTNVHGVHGPQLSEAAFAAMLSFSRHLPAVYDNQRDANWKKLSANLLYKKKVAILGLGAIANDLAPRCKAFGMRVVGISSTVREIANFDEVINVADLKRAVSDADYLVVLTPYSARTHHIIDESVLNAMKPSSVLINIARGGVVDESALLAALDKGEIAGAALDVFEVEPLPASHPFWKHPKVLVTPHSAGFHEGYSEDAYNLIRENFARFLEGGVANLENRV
ncbi:MAG: D-2-hydroxyacid dehydrogenase [Parvularculaceae bacterium]